MLSAADLNSKFDEFATQFLLPLGFTKSGIHYFKKTDKDYFAIIKDTSRGYFLDYYLCYCPSVATTQFKLLQKKPSSMLKDYPVSIAIDDLEIVYTNNENLLRSPFYFYSLSRQFKIGKDCTENISVWNEYYRRIIVRNEQLTTNSLYLQNFVTTLFSSLQKYGFRFFNECSIDLCYQSVKRAFNDKKMSQYSTYYTELISQFEEYYKQNNLQTPEIIIQRKQNWLSRLFSSN